MLIKTAYKTPNKHPGTNTCDYIILHHTATGEGSAKGVIERFCNPNAKPLASCHYVVDTNGDIYSIGNETDILWHAGVSEWKGLKDKYNSFWSYSIGIEVIWPLANGGFTDAQRVSVGQLIKDICTRHQIPEANILRHKDIAPTRKVDIYDSFWKNQYKTWEEYRGSLFTPRICPDVAADARYAEAVKRAIQNKITSANFTTPFNPEKPATRAELVQFLFNFEKYLKSK